MSVLPIVALILSIVATVLAFIFIIPEKKRNSLNAFGKFLHDTLNFKYLVVEKILQALYVFSTAFVILLGFCMLFYVQPGYSSRYYSQPDQWYGGYGLLIMILGPIVVRLSYEFIMMAILLVKNVTQINSKLSQPKTEEKTVTSAFSVPTMPQKPVASFCPNCGRKVNAGEFCPQCGTKIV